MNFIKKHAGKLILLLLIAAGAVALFINWDKVKEWYNAIMPAASPTITDVADAPAEQAKSIARVTSATPKLMAEVGGLR